MFSTFIDCKAIVNISLLNIIAYSIFLTVLGSK